MEDNVMNVFVWVVAFMAVVKNHLNVIVALVQILKEEESTLVYIVINVRILKTTKDCFRYQIKYFKKKSFDFY